MLLSFAPPDLALLASLDHLLAYAIRANSRRGEGIIRFGRKQPFTGVVLVFRLRQIGHRAENHSSVQTSILMGLRMSLCRRMSIHECCHCVLSLAIAISWPHSEQNFASDPRKRTSKTPQPSQNLSSQALTTSEECRDFPYRSIGLQCDTWLMWLTCCSLT